MAGRDICICMPTGVGKSLTYQIPSIIQDGVTLVIMPLITIPELYWISELFNGWNKIIVVTFSSFILVPIIFYLIALDTSERTIVISYVKSKISCTFI